MISNIGRRKVLAQFARCYLSLHTGEPGEGGENVVGTRQLFEGMLMEGELTNVAEQISFEGLNGLTLTHLGFWDAASGGNFLGHTALEIPVKLEYGAEIAFAPMSIFVTVNS